MFRRDNKKVSPVQYNLSTPDLVYSGFLSNPAKHSGTNSFPVYLIVKNSSVIRILWIPNSGLI